MTQILQKLDLPLDAYPYPNWLKSLIRFANRSKWHLALCFILGLFAFPLGLIWLILLQKITHPHHPKNRKGAIAALAADIMDSMTTTKSINSGVKTMTQSTVTFSLEDFLTLT
jgi:hypothetical protein